MTQPGQIGSAVSNDGDVMRMIADLQRQVKELAAANVFAPMGVTPTPGGFTVTGTETVTGELIVNGPETVNGPLNVNGAMAVTGTLSLPAGIIDNAALQAPVSPLATHAGTNNFGLATGANVEILRATISVPSGYTRALVYETATMHAWNNNTSADDGYLTTSINGAGFGASSQTTAAAGGSICIPSTGSILLTSLGATFYVSALASSGSLAWAVNSNNFVNLDVMTIFLR